MTPGVGVTSGVAVRTTGVGVGVAGPADAYVLRIASRVVDAGAHTEALL